MEIEENGNRENENRENGNQKLNNLPNLKILDYKKIHQAIKYKLLSDPNFSWASHHLESCNLFYNKGIQKLFQEHNPIELLHDYNDEMSDYIYKCRLYLGGKSGDKIYYGKPLIYENGEQKYMYPNEARLRNMTYGFTIHYDVEIEYEIYDKEGKQEVIEAPMLEKVYFGKFPIMLKSNMCILENLTPDMCYSMGECKQDYGGYFIIDGKEKVIIPQEKFGNNMIYSRKLKADGVQKYDYSIEIKSVSEDSSKPQRTLRIMREVSTPQKEKNFFVVEVPNVRKPVPFFILMRALGFQSDKDIIESVVLDIKENEHYLELFRNSIYDAGELFTQGQCIQYIGLLTKRKNKFSAHQILCDYLLPHLGEKNYKKKGHYLAYMLMELIKVINGEKQPTDRDHFKYKRVETSGDLMFQLCNEYLNLQYKNIFQKIDKEYYYHQGIYNNDYTKLIENNYAYFFEDKIVNDGFKRAFKGNWGAFSHTKRDGVVQDLNRLSFNSYLSHLRKVNLPFDSSAKVVGPRLCHGSQYGLIDPIDTPDGGNVGLHKHLTVATKISVHIDPKSMINWLDSNITIYYLGFVSNKLLLNKTKLFVNGNYLGCTDEPFMLKEKFLTARRIGLIPYFVSFCFMINENIIEIYCDGGRLIRPTFYTQYEKEHQSNVSLSRKKTYISYEQSKSLMNSLINEPMTYSWFNCLTGFVNKKKNIIPEISTDLESLITSNVEDLYETAEIDVLNKNQGIIDYLDASETESIYLCSKIENYEKDKNYTHIDIDSSLLLGIMGNQIVFPEHNPLPRDLFGCGQAKQAVSRYHSNFRHRIDKMGVNLNYGQQPILRSNYLKYIQNNKHPHGENTIVAIMCYSSYNVEDAILINQGALDRGIFRTTYYNMYETFEETTKTKSSMVDSRITNLFNENIERTKPGYDYNYLDSNGLVKENTKMNDKITVIGKITLNSNNPDEKTDTSIYPKKGQLGYVDKAYISDDEEGKRLAKVRIREERIPAMGDKFCSRCGQKGTIGNIIPESDMPFTSDGIRPDIIINPHAIPSRMTIGQLIETIIGKSCLNLGAFADGTAFLNLSEKYKPYGDILTKQFGYHSKGNEILYNGMNGNQIETEIFIGPTYYMRLKHMVKDKINYRSKGPRTMLTRQTVQGRANDGGLRVGEMERDAIASHGASEFLRQSMMERGDKYKIAICNKTGSLAIYNPNKNLFVSPLSDGPIKFNILSNDNIQMVQKTEFGHDFSVVEVPYAFKLLMQELISCNIQMKIITEDNVDQLTNVLYSGREITMKQLDEREKQSKQDKKEKANPRPFFDFGINLLGEQQTEEGKDEEKDEEKEELNVEKQPTTTNELEELEEAFVSPSLENKIILREDEEEDEDEEDIPLPEKLKTQQHLPWEYIRDEEDNESLYVSLLRDNKGNPTDIWPPNSNVQIPDIYPREWDHKLVKKYGLDETRIVELLKLDKSKNNWNKVTKQLIDEKQNKELRNSAILKEQSKQAQPVIIQQPQPIIIQQPVQSTQQPSQAGEQQPLQAAEQQSQSSINSPPYVPTSPSPYQPNSNSPPFQLQSNSPPFKLNSESANSQSSMDSNTMMELMSGGDNKEELQEVNPTVSNNPDIKVMKLS